MLTTHVLDTSRGRPAAGMRIDVSVVEPDGRTRLLRTATTNADGRTEGPLLGGGELALGQYELLFHVGEYFLAAGTPPAEPAFYDRVPVRFVAAEFHRHYHVPLLVSPYGYVTYRGS